MRWCCLVWMTVDLSLGSVAHHLGRLKTKRGLRWCECNKAKILDAPSGQCGGENMMLMTLMRIWWREVADGWCGVRCLCGRRSWGCRHDRYGTIMMVGVSGICWGNTAGWRLLRMTRMAGTWTVPNWTSRLFKLIFGMLMHIACIFWHGLVWVADVVEVVGKLFLGGDDVRVLHHVVESVSRCVVWWCVGTHCECEGGETWFVCVSICQDKNVRLSMSLLNLKL